MDKSTKRRLVDGDITRQHSYCDEMVVQNWGMLRYDGTPPSPPPKKNILCGDKPTLSQSSRFIGYTEVIRG